MLPQIKSANASTFYNFMVSIKTVAEFKNFNLITPVHFLFAKRLFMRRVCLLAKLHVLCRLIASTVW
jgi:hypothetical protein